FTMPPQRSQSDFFDSIRLGCSLLLEAQIVLCDKRLNRAPVLTLEIDVGRFFLVSLLHPLEKIVWSAKGAVCLHFVYDALCYKVRKLVVSQGLSGEPTDWNLSAGERRRLYV